MDRTAVLIQLNSHAGVSGDQWIHLLPAGTIRTRDDRGPYRLTDPDAVINASRQHAGTRQMPIDYDHAIDLAAPRGQAAPAAGWVNAMQSRADGIWGRVDWTPRAAKQLADREYRYLSPVISHDAAGNVLGILRASLTNTPNLEQLRALSSMETNMDKLPELRAKLGLPADATIDDILAKIDELAAAKTAAQSATTPDPAKFVPIGDFERVVAQVNELHQGVSLQAATSHVTDIIGRGHLLPYLKDWGIKLCSTNKPAFDAFVSKTKGGLDFLRTETHARGLPVDRDGSRADLTQEEISIAANLGVSAEDFLKSKTTRGKAQE